MKYSISLLTDKLDDINMELETFKFTRAILLAKKALKADLEQAIAILQEK